MRESINKEEFVSYFDISVEGLHELLENSAYSGLLEGDDIRFSQLPGLLSYLEEKLDFSKRRWAIPDWLANNSEAWACVLRDMYREHVSFPASLPPEQGVILRDIVLREKPEKIVEIGCFIGISSIWLGSAAKDNDNNAKIISIDLFQKKMPAKPYRLGYLEDPLGYAQSSAKAAGLTEIIKFVKSNSISFGKEYNRSTEGEIDLLYIDGDHSVGGCVDDFITFYPHVKVGGAVVLHDTNPENCGWYGPRYLLDRIIGKDSSFAIQEIETMPNFGMAVIRKLSDNIKYHPLRNPKIDIIRYHHRLKRKKTYRDLFNKYIKPYI